MSNDSKKKRVVSKYQCPTTNMSLTNMSLKTIFNHTPRKHNNVDVIKYILPHIHSQSNTR